MKKTILTLGCIALLAGCGGDDGDSDKILSLQPEEGFYHGKLETYGSKDDRFNMAINSSIVIDLNKEDGEYKYADVFELRKDENKKGYAMYAQAYTITKTYEKDGKFCFSAKEYTPNNTEENMFNDICLTPSNNEYIVAKEDFGDGMTFKYSYVPADIEDSSEGIRSYLFNNLKNMAKNKKFMNALAVSGPGYREVIGEFLGVNLQDGEPTFKDVSPNDGFVKVE